MGAEAAVIAAQMIANAIKASGTVVRIEPEEFLKILKKIEAPLVIYAEGGMISTNYQYLISYKGFAFYTKADDPIELPRNVEVVVADKIWIPG
jgi:GGDEF domain-containing protein